MPRIRILNKITADQIAAGEVVERPASVVKELCENSLDAGASVININIRNGGITLIEVSDNGSGMESEDLGLAFCRHATSKLNTIEDLNTIITMGFRGEALSSIASVSKVTLRSRKIMSDKGYMITVEGGEIISEGPASVNEGTSITVESLFYNTPARYKFLKKDSTEASYITDIVERAILARPDVSFRLVSDGKEILHSPGNNDLKSAIFAVYGKDVTAAVLPVEYLSSGITVSGYSGRPSLSRKTRQHQSFFVNGRYIKSALLNSAVEEAYRTLLMKGQFAFCVLNIEIDPAEIDVNVHPQKTQVKFRRESDIFRAVVYSVNEAISDKIPVPEITVVQESVSLKENIPVQEITPTKDLSPVNESNSGQETRSAVDYFSFEKQTQHRSGVMELDEQTILIRDISGMKYAGTVFDTYLIYESGNEIVLVDQHAAHERIIFEELIEQFSKTTIHKQTLIVPEVVELPPSQILLAEENMELLNSIGFDCEIFGPAAMLLRTVPLSENKITPSEGFRSVISSLNSGSSDGKHDISSILYTMACKAAVKAHDKLKPEEIAALAERLSKANRNTLCPHGRPVSIKISRYEIEKWFKRVVN